METGVPNIICASEIASAINLCDLNDVSDNACDPDQCALLVYQKTANCGANCKGVNDMWVPWTVADHKSDYLTYVMGFNDEGCPIVLDVPGDKSKYWWAMWRGDSKFGYTQPNKVDNLPTDSNGDPLVISQNADGNSVIGSFTLNGNDATITRNIFTSTANGNAAAGATTTADTTSLTVVDGTGNAKAGDLISFADYRIGKVVSIDDTTANVAIIYAPKPQEATSWGNITGTLTNQTFKISKGQKLYVGVGRFWNDIDSSDNDDEFTGGVEITYPS